MNAHAWRYHIAAVLMVAAYTLPQVTQATIITSTITDRRALPGDLTEHLVLTGEFAYDDAASISGTGIFAGWTLSELTSFTALYTLYPTTWDIDDLINPAGYRTYWAVDGRGFDFGAIVTLSLAANAYQIVTTFTNPQAISLQLAPELAGGSDCPGPLCIYFNDDYGVSPFADYEQGGGGSFVITTAVPEPPVLSLLCLGFAVMGFTRRRKTT